MVRQNNFNSDLHYVGINTGHLGFLQDVKIDEVDEFIDDLMSENNLTNTNLIVGSTLKPK